MVDAGGRRRLTTAEAAARLGVKPATLYAYVSRGLLGRERAADGRTSTFDPAEVDRLARPGRPRRGRRPAADLVIPSALTAIDRGLPWYRGLPVPDLAGSRSFEEVATWLWTGRFPAPGEAVDSPQHPGPGSAVDGPQHPSSGSATLPHRGTRRAGRGVRRDSASGSGGVGGGTGAVPAWQASDAALEAGRRAQAALPSTALPLERIRVIAAALAAGDELRLELHPAAVTAAGRSLIAGLVDCLPRPGPPDGGPAGRQRRRGRVAVRPGPSLPDEAATVAREATSRAEDSIAARLWAGLSPLHPEPGLVGAVDTALVLLADHELAASTVAARVAASVRADPYAVVSAGLAAVSGTLHGGASLGIEALLDEIDRPERAASVVGARLRQGERLRGFGHRLYPDGDPRAGVLLARLRDTAAGSPRLAVVEALLEAAAQRGLPEPNIDLALAALAHVTGMTRGAAEAVFAVARTAGWIAHALEEYDRDTPIRPRALYTGPTPGT